MFEIGYLVRMNGKYHVSEEKKGKVWEIASQPWDVCGKLVVKLKGMTGSYAVDGLELAMEERALLPEVGREEERNG